MTRTMASPRTQSSCTAREAPFSAARPSWDESLVVASSLACQVAVAIICSEEFVPTIDSKEPTVRFNSKLENCLTTVTWRRFLSAQRHGFYPCGIQDEERELICVTI